MRVGTRGALLRRAALVIACASYPPACADQRCELSSCDIRDESCQASVLEAVVCVRGGERRDVPVRVVDADAYIDEQVRVADSREDADDTADWYAGLKSLRLSRGLDAGEAERAYYENLAGFYDPENDRVTILDRGGTLEGWELSLAHEFVHALQDREHDLSALHDAHDETVDGSLALAAIVEGEATLYADQLNAMAIGFGLDDVAWSSAFASFRQRSREYAQQQEEPILRLRSAFAYGYGSSYVYEAWRQGGNEAVRALFEMPPVSSRQVMLGPYAGPPDGQPWLDEELADVALPVLDPRFEVVGYAQLGSYALWIFLERWRAEDVDREPEEHVDGDPLQQAGVRGLRADVLTVLRSTAGEMVVTWRMRFADESDAARVIGEIGAPFHRERAIGNGHAWSSGRDAFFVVGPDVLPADIETLAWTAIPEPEPPASEEASAAHGRRFE